MFISIVLLLSYSIYTIRHLNRSIDEIVNQQYIKVELATTVRDEVNNIVKALRNYALTDSEKVKQENLDKINQARDNGAKALLSLEKLTNDDQGILIINHLKSISMEYLQFQQDVLKKIQDGSIAEASKMISEDGQNYQQNLLNNVNDLVNINKLSMQHAVQNSLQIYNSSILYLLISTLVFFLLGAVLTSLITRNLTLGLAKVSNVMDGFTKGTVDLGTRLEVESKDEIGVVSLAFNQMASSLESQVKCLSGEEALKAVLKEDYAVILLDVQMPGLDGYETARLIKSREKSKDTPIIFVTAINKEPEHVFSGYTIGAIDYLFKPFDPDILKTKVEQLIKIFVNAREIKQQAERFQEQTKELEIANQELFRVTCDLQKSEALHRLVGETSMDTIIIVNVAHEIISIPHSA